MKPINTFCGQNEELLIVKENGTCSYGKALKSEIKQKISQ
jgi:thioredoxin-related protein